MTPESCPAAEGVGNGCGPTPGAGCATGSVGGNLPNVANAEDATIRHWRPGVLVAISLPVSHQRRMRYGVKPVRWASNVTETRPSAMVCSPPGVGEIGLAGSQWRLTARKTRGRPTAIHLVAARADVSYVDAVEANSLRQRSHYACNSSRQSTTALLGEKSVPVHPTRNAPTVKSASYWTAKVADSSDSTSPDRCLFGG
jgi:hypothetical protein